METTNSLVKLSLIGMFVCILVLEGIPDLYSQSKNVNCDKLISEAEQKYRQGNFDAAINGLVECVAGSDLSEEQTQKAYRLLGLSYLAKDYEKDARDAISKLLDLVPNYQSDSVQDPPTYTKIVEELRKTKKDQPKPTLPGKENQKKGSSKKWWIFGGIGAGVATGVAILVFGGRKTEKGILDITVPNPGN